MRSFTVFTTSPKAIGLLAVFLLGPAPASPAVGSTSAAASTQALATAEIRVLPDETRLRRDRLVALLRADLQDGERGLFVIAGARAADLTEFRQNADFLYLTGLMHPGAVLVLAFDANAATEVLYLPPRDSRSERWTGTVLGPGELAANGAAPDEERLKTAALTGMRGAAGTPGSGVEGIPELAGDLKKLAGSGLVVFLPDLAGGEAEEIPPEMKLLAPLMEGSETLRKVSAREALTRLRLVKSPIEIAAIRRAVEITCAGLRAAMHAMRPGLMEYEIEADIEYEFTRAGARFNAFPTIVGSGPNSCILHHSGNARKILPGEVVVIDAGAEVDGYAADVTRTLSSTGRFDDKQSRIYKAVLEAQAAGLELVRPGSRIRDINDKVKAFLGEKHLEEYIVHGCCHFVGLNVHDLGDSEVLLEPGMVLTVEPGVYIPEKAIGVRIEDTVLVTPGGHEVLSACVPKDPEEVRAEMSRPGGARP